MLQLFLIFLYNQYIVYTEHYKYCSVEVYPEGGSVVFNVKSCILCHKRSINSPLLYVQLLYFDAVGLFLSLFQTSPTIYYIFRNIHIYL